MDEEPPPLRRLPVPPGDAWGIGDDGGEAVALFLRASLGFTAFCLLSSAGYLLNDTRDVARDRAHPRKRDRPVAAGRIPARRAYLAALALDLLGLVVGAPLGSGFGLVAGAIWRAPPPTPCG